HDEAGKSWVSGRGFSCWCSVGWVAWPSTGCGSSLSERRRSHTWKRWCEQTKEPHLPSAEWSEPTRPHEPPAHAHPHNALDSERGHTMLNSVELSCTVIETKDVEPVIYEWGAVKWVANSDIAPSCGQSFGLVHILPGKGNPEHWHTAAGEIVFMLQGE